MKSLVIVVLGLLAAGCNSEPDAELEDDSAAEVPIGPGTDTSALSSPDTPMSQQGKPIPDSVRKRVR